MLCDHVPFDASTTLVIDTNDNVFLGEALKKIVGLWLKVTETIDGLQVQNRFGGGSAGDICRRTFDYPFM